MQRVASITPGATNAPVGQAGMHAVHFPQLRRDGGLDGSGIETSSSASRT